MFINRIKVLIADDHLLVREGLVVMLNTQPEIEVVGETGSGNELIDLASNLKPNVVLADINLPEINGIDATSQIHKHQPDIRIILMADNASEVVIIRALRNGALGFLVRQENFQHVLHAIRLVTEGKRYLSRQCVDKIIDVVIAGTYIDENLDEKISAREKEILQMIVQGYTSAQIGEKLEISKRTVETHRTNIMRKLGLNSQIEIIKFAIRNGLFPTE